MVSKGDEMLFINIDEAERESKIRKTSNLTIKVPYITVSVRDCSLKLEFFLFNLTPPTRLLRPQFDTILLKCFIKADF